MVREILCEIGVAARAVSVPCPNMYNPRNPHEKVSRKDKSRSNKKLFPTEKGKMYFHL